MTESNNLTVAMAAEETVSPKSTSNTTVKCPKGHPIVKLKEKLKSSEGLVHTYSCNPCGRTLDRNEPRWKCEFKCKFNVCQGCLDTQQQTGILPSKSSASLGGKSSASLGGDSEAVGNNKNPLCCPNGHQVVKLKDKLQKWQGHVNTRKCNACTRKLVRDEPHWRCEHHCKFNVCQDCKEEHEEKGSLEYDPTMTNATNATLKATGPMANGFPMVEEGECIRVSSENVSPFSMPREVLEYAPGPDFIVTTLGNGDKERKIHCNTELNQQELDGLRIMQRMARSQRKAYFPSISVAATRFLATARGDTKKAIKMMDEAQQWRKDYFAAGPITDESVAEDFKHGIIYFAGRDSGMRPTITIRANRVPAAWYKDGTGGTKLLRILVFSVEYLVRYMCVPGKVESQCLMVDLEGLGATQVPFKELKEIYSVMSHFYPGRLARVYICNLSGMLGMAMGAAKGLLTDRQKAKLAYIKDLKELMANFAPHQLEEKLGGSRPNLTQFFPFPIAEGPYDVSCTSGPDAKAVKNIHEVFDKDGVLGRLWDPKKDAKQNTYLVYSADAVEIFERLGLPVPEDAAKPPVFEEEADEEEEDEEVFSEAEDVPEPGKCQKCLSWFKGLCRPADATEAGFVQLAEQPPA